MSRPSFAALPFTSTVADQDVLLCPEMRSVSFTNSVTRLTQTPDLRAVAICLHAVCVAETTLSRSGASQEGVPFDVGDAAGRGPRPLPRAARVRARGGRAPSEGVPGGPLRAGPRQRHRWWATLATDRSRFSGTLRFQIAAAIRVALHTASVSYCVRSCRPVPAGSKVPKTRVFGKVNLERPDFECETSTVVSFVPFDSRFVIHKMMDGRVVFNATYQVGLAARDVAGGAVAQLLCRITDGESGQMAAAHLPGENDPVISVSLHRSVCWVSDLAAASSTAHPSQLASR